MTRAEIRTEVQRRLRESSSLAVFWTEADINASIDDGYEEMSDAAEWYVRHQIVDILEQQRYYDMRTQLRRGFLAIGPAYNPNTSRWLIQVSPRDLGNGDNRWERRVSEPEYMVIRGLWFVGYWPFKATAVGKIKQYYAALPPAMVQDTDEPGFADQFHYGLVEYALWDLFAQDGESDLAYAAWKLYIEFESRLGAHQPRVGQTPSVRGMAASWRPS